jgi:hypothetical protein
LDSIALGGFANRAPATYVSWSSSYVADRQQDGTELEDFDKILKDTAMYFVEISKRSQDSEQV